MMNSIISVIYRFKQKYTKIYYCILAYLVYLLYYPVNIYSYNAGRFNLNSIFLDDMIPFLPIFQIWYIFIFLFPFFAVFYIRDNEYFELIAKVIMFQYLSGYVIFLIHPVKMIRVEVLPDTFLNWMIHLNHMVDKPYNCFPSLHMACSISVAMFIYKLNRKDSIIPFIVAALIGLSIVYVKAHTVLDGLGGLGMSLISYILFIRPYKLTKPKEYYHRNHVVFLYVFGIYGLIMLISYIMYRLGMFI